MNYRTNYSIDHFQYFLNISPKWSLIVRLDNRYGGTFKIEISTNYFAARQWCASKGSGQIMLPKELEAIKWKSSIIGETNRGKRVYLEWFSIVLIRTNARIRHDKIVMQNGTRTQLRTRGNSVDHRVFTRYPSLNNSAGRLPPEILRWAEATSAPCSLSTERELEGTPPISVLYSLLEV